MRKNLILKGVFLILFLCFISNIILGTGSNTDKQKIILLCFDGVDGKMTAEYMSQGYLPNLKKLSENGSFSFLDTTNPPQTPVSWAAFTTGWHPGKTEIFDFLKRDSGSYIPNFSQITIISKQILFGKDNPIILGLIAAAVIFILAFIFTKIFTKKKKLSIFIPLSVSIIVFLICYIFVKMWIPVSNTFVENNRKGTPFWDVLNLNGIKTKIFNIPVTFPAVGTKNGYLLTGLGTPDITGSIGKPSYFTTSKSMSPSTGEFSSFFSKLEPSSDGIYSIQIEGPDLQNVTFIDDKPETAMKPKILKIPAQLIVNKEDRSLTIDLQGQRQTLKEGQWSDWFEMKFKINPVLAIWGIGRFCLNEAVPDLKLYLSPLHMHPEHTLIPVTYPKSWSHDLFKKYGLYKTLGWAVDTWSLQEQLIDEKSFLEDAYYTRHQNEIMMLDALKDGDQKVQVHYFEYIDRIQHLFWRLIDEQHPYYNAEKANTYKNTILESYQDMDRVVGEVMAKIKEDTILFVISDHGFLSWRRAINYNTWLAENGYLEKSAWDQNGNEIDDLFKRRAQNFWQNIDWSKTKAYAIGIGNIYLNVLGREPEGIVTNDEYDRIRDEIINKMPALIDPATGLHPIVKVYKREDIWDEFNPTITPDLRVCTNKYYRVSWQSTLGNTPENLYYENANNWSADHCSADPSMVQGIFFCNKKITKKENPKLVDFFPTILDLYGINPAKYKPSGVDLFK